MEITIRYTLTFPNGNYWNNCKQSFNLMDLHSLIDMNTLLHDERTSNFEIVNKDVQKHDPARKRTIKRDQRFLIPVVHSFQSRTFN